jgi:transposase
MVHERPYEEVLADNGILRCENQILQCDNQLLRRSNEDLNAKWLLISHKYQLLLREKYGQKSERFSTTGEVQGVLPLFPEEEPAPVEPPVATTIVEAHERAARPRKTLAEKIAIADNVERRTVVIQPEGVDVERCKELPGTENTRITYIPPSFLVETMLRPKYKDPLTGIIHQAPAPDRSFARHSVDETVAAQVVVQKIVDHLPLYRTAKMFARHGVAIPESTLGDIYAEAARILEPLYEAHRKEVLSSGYINVDETVIQVMDSEKKGATHRGYYWVCYDNPSRSVLFVYDRSRGRAAPQQLLDGYQGYLQTDGYAVYDEFENVPGITLAGCLAHARRKFFEAKDSDKTLAEEALSLFGQVYAVEKHIRENGLTGDEKLAYRQAHAVPALAALHAWLMEKYESIRLPSSRIRKAAEYTLSRWKRLALYAGTSQLDPDNNRVENSIRPVAVGRKNYLFAGSHEAAQRSAMFYSLLGTCKAHGIEPFAWLSDVLARLPYHPQKRIGELLPQHYRRAEVKQD